MATEEMSADGEPSKQQIVETLHGLQSRVQQLEEENRELREDKSELEQRLDDLEDNSVTRTSLNVLLQALTGGDIDDMTADPMQCREYAVDVNDRISDLESDVAAHDDKISTIGEGESSGPEEAWHNITQAAQRLAGSRENGLPNNRVRLYVDNIAQATGKCERHASNYIDRFGGDTKHSKRGAKKRDYKPPSNQNGGEAQKKSLVVDLDVWGEDDD